MSPVRAPAARARKRGLFGRPRVLLELRWRIVWRCVGLSFVSQLDKTKPLRGEKCPVALVGALRGQRRRRTIPRFLTCVVALLALLVSATGGLSTGSTSHGQTAAAVTARPTVALPPHPPLPPRVSSQQFSGSFDVDDIVSNQSTALVNLLLDDGASELVLYSAPHNSTRVIQAEVPGGSNTVLTSQISAGGAFDIAWVNDTTGQEFWEKVTLAGKITYPSLPLGGSYSWTFVYGNATALFASAGSFLVELDARSFTTIANYSTLLPAGVAVDSVLPVGHRLYLGGDRIVTGSQNAYFGYLDLNSMKVTSVSKFANSYPSYLKGAFVSLLGGGTTIYAGGALSTFDLAPYTASSNQGYLFSFDPSGSVFKNLSSLLPVRSWGVWALVPWGSKVGLSLSGYFYNDTVSSLDGGVYTLSDTGRGLVNRTALLPIGYLADILGETSASGVWFFSGGYNSISGNAEVVAVKA